MYIKKIENLKDDNVFKTVMTISAENGLEKEAEVFLAYMDANADKKYIVYTTENTNDENARIPFNLAVMREEDDEIVLEAANKEEHKDELEIINKIGLNSIDDATRELQSSFPGFGIIDLEQFTSKFNKVTISEKRPPRKANMPLLIANVIKKFYIHQLNKILKDIHSKEKISIKEKEEINENLDKVADKLDDVKGIYENYIDKNPFEPSKAIDSIHEINDKFNDIEEAKDRLDSISMFDNNDFKDVSEDNLNDSNLPNDLESGISAIYNSSADDIPPLQQFDLNNEEANAEFVRPYGEDVLETMESLKQEQENNEDLVESKDTSSIEPTKIEQTFESSPAIESSTFEQYKPKEINTDVSEKEKNVVDKTIEMIATKLQEYVIGMKNEFEQMYKPIIDEQKQVINELTNKLNEQEKRHSEEISELTKMFEEFKRESEANKARAEEQKDMIKQLQEEKSILINENESLKNEVSDQKDLLNRQNQLMEGLKEEKNNNELSLKNQISELEKEKNSLLLYKEGYNKLQVLFNTSLVPKEEDTKTK